MITQNKNAVCLIANCGRPAITRGLCSSCYQTAIKAVLRKRVTWPELVSMGLARDARYSRKSVFEVALAGKQKQEKSKRRAKA